MVQECTGAVIGAGLTWNKTINHDLYLLPFHIKYNSLIKISLLLFQIDTNNDKYYLNNVIF